MIVADEGRVNEFVRGKGVRAEGKIVVVLVVAHLNRLVNTHGESKRKATDSRV